VSAEKPSHVLSEGGGDCKGTLRYFVSSNSSLPAFLESIGLFSLL